MVLRSQKRSNSNEAGAGRPNKLYNEFQFIVSVHVGTLTVLLGLQRGKKFQCASCSAGDTATEELQDSLVETKHQFTLQ